MPAPPFLVGLSAGASVAAIVRVVARSADSDKRNRPPMTVKPKRFHRVPPSEQPKDPCVECEGSGRVECPQCKGRGRTNLVDQAMLPKSVWPEWCEYCSGSGKINCSRCQGLGKFRQKIGFDMDD